MELEQLSVLFLEDSDKDIEIIQQVLANDIKCPVQMNTADTESRFLDLLKTKKYDLILADHTLPGYNAAAALASALSVCPEIPFIVVSGPVGEDVAVELLKQGAADYVLKDRLGRLPFAVRRALEGAREKAARSKAEREQLEYRRSLEEAQRIAHIGSWEWDLAGNEYRWSDEIYRIFGVDRHVTPEVAEISYNFSSPDDKDRFEAAVRDAFETGEPYDVEVGIVRPDGEVRYVRGIGVVQFGGDGRPVLARGISQDITERRMAELEAARTKEFEHLAAQIASDFINLPFDELDPAIENALGMIGEHFHADRCSVWLYNCQNETVKCRYLWYKQPQMKTPDKYHAVTFTDIIEFINCHKQNKIFYQKNMEDLPKGSTYRSIAMEVGTKSIVSIPLHVGGKLIGCYSFIYADEEKALIVKDPTVLEILAKLISNVLARKEQEEALRDLSESNRLILESSNDGIVMFDRDGFILNLNEKYASIVGRTAKESIGLNFGIEGTEDFFRERLAILRKVYDTGEPHTFEGKGTREGSFFSFRLYPVFKGGRVCAVTLFTTDIAAQKKAEEERKRHTAYERTIRSLAQDFINMPFEMLEDAIKNAMGLVAGMCGVDRAAAYQYDWEKQVAIQISEWDKKPEYNQSVTLRSVPLSAIGYAVACHKKGLAYVRNGKEDLPTESQFRQLGEAANCESALISPLIKETHLFGMIVFTSVEKQKTWSEHEGSIIQVFCEMMTNVLLRKEREEALRQLNESYRLILDSTNDGIAMFDHDGVLLNINQKFAGRFGKKVEEVIRMNRGALLPEEVYGSLSQQRLNKLQKAFDTGESEFFEDSRDGSIYYNRFYPVFKDKRVSAVALFSTDITAQKKASEEAAKRAEYQARNKLLTDFFTNISHEFKTPLTIILNSIEMTEMRFKNIEFENKDRAFKNLAIMRQNAQRLLRLVANLLDVTKIDAGFLQVNLQELDISGWMGKLIESVEDYAARRGIAVTFADDSEIHSMPMDGEKLDRIMLNLLSNSIKHTGTGGHIIVSLSDTVDKILITVEDDGEGIPDDKRELIFDRFRQVNTSLTRSSEGSGIGLALSRALVELLHGRIWFESRFGEGTKFFVELPVEQTPNGSKVSVIDGLTLNRKVEMEFSDII